MEQQSDVSVKTDMYVDDIKSEVDDEYEMEDETNEPFIKREVVKDEPADDDDDYMLVPKSEAFEVSIKAEVEDPVKPEVEDPLDLEDKDDPGRNIDIICDCIHGLDQSVVYDVCKDSIIFMVTMSE